MSNLYEDKQSKCCYKGTDVLINKFNIMDANKLSEVEANITTLNSYKLIYNPIYGEFDLKHLQNIHKAIFSDIYPFAGKIRNEEIWKGVWYALPQYIEPYANNLFKDLHKEKCLRGLPKDEFCNRAAYYMTEINFLHPFREGNGRSQREFIRTLAMNCGYEINWNRVSKDEIYKAAEQSVNKLDLLVRAINTTICNEEPDIKLIKLFEMSKDNQKQVSIKENIVKNYTDCFPAIKNITEKSAIIISNLNKTYNHILSVKEIKGLYKDSGKKIESNSFNNEDRENFNNLKSVMDDFKHAQIVEKQAQSHENLQSQHKTMEHEL